MTGAEGAVAGGVVAVALAAFKLIDKVLDKKNGSPPIPVVIQDANGNKITNKDLLLNQRELVDLQRDSVGELKTMNRNFIAHDERTVEILKEIRKGNGTDT